MCVNTYKFTSTLCFCVCSFSLICSRCLYVQTATPGHTHTQSLPHYHQTTERDGKRETGISTIPDLNSRTSVNVIRTPHFGFSMNWGVSMVCLSPQNTTLTHQGISNTLTFLQELWTWNLGACCIFLLELICGLTWANLFLFSSSFLILFNNIIVTLHNMYFMQWPKKCSLQQWRVNHGTYNTKQLIMFFCIFLGQHLDSSL